MQSSKQSHNTVEVSNSFAERVDALLDQMTLAEKIGQMTQVEKNSISPEDVANYFIGSVLSGGGGNPTPNSPQSWAQMVKSFQETALETRLAIPLIYGVDAVHGHSNVVGAVIFPHNVGLGATRDPELMERIGFITAKELLATNVHWDFSPAVSVPHDVRWGRAYEGFSEDTDVVISLSMALARGLQQHQPNGTWVLPSVKHFLADGGTTWGSTKPSPWLDSANWQAATPHWKIDQGDALIDEATLRSVHLRPYEVAIKDGVMNIMVSFSSWNGQKMHNNKYLLTDVVKGELGFEGFLVSDWMAINQIDAEFYNCVVQAINAGLDMIMVPYDYKNFITALTDAVNKGDVTEARIDDAVRRILRAKFALGLFEQPFGDESLLDEVGSDAHRAVAREAVRKSLVLLKNDDNLLPLKKDLNLLVVAGAGADNIGVQCGGWTIDWQGGSGATTIGTTLLEGIRQVVIDHTELLFNENGEFPVGTMADVGIVVIAEQPYAEGMGDRIDLHIPEADIALIERTRKQCEKLVLIVISGRPLIITEQVPLVDALIAAWLPGTEGAGVADVLFGDYPFTGKLAYSWLRSADQLPLETLKTHPDGPLFPFGFGLET